MESLSNKLITIYWKHISGKTLTDEERQQWRDWQATHPDVDDFSILRAELRLHHQAELAKAASLERFWAKFEQQYPGSIAPSIEPKQPFLRRHWKMAAAVVLLLLGTWYAYYAVRQPKPAVGEVTVAPQPLPPGDTAALVGLPDGQQLAVSASRTGTILEYGPVQVERLPAGALVYKTHDNASVAAASGLYSIQSLPGKTLQVRLPDNSEAYLNTASSIAFAVSVNSQTRKVQLKGQASFHITPNKDTFYVVTGGDSVEVTGTRFGVRAYPGERYKDIVLTEGTIRIYHGGKRLAPLPGKTVRLTGTDSMQYLNKNAYEMTAFRDGNFYYDGSTLYTILQDIGRWYQVGVADHAALHRKHYHLDPTPRSTPLPELLHKLEKLSNLRFRQRNQQIEVVP